MGVYFGCYESCDVIYTFFLDILEWKIENKQKCLGNTVLHSETVAKLSTNLLLERSAKKSKILKL